MVCGTHMLIEVFSLMHLTLLPVFVDEFQLSLVEVSLLVSIQSFVGLVMNVPAGILADRLNPKVLLIGSMMIEGGSALLISQMHQYWTLVLGVALMSIASPVYHISGLSQISTSATRKQISSLMGTHNALGSIGAAMGSLSLSVSLATLGWRTIYLVWSLPILLWGGVLFRSFPIETIRSVPEQSPVIPRSVKLTRIFNRDFLVFLTSIGVREVGVTSIVTFMTLYLVTVRGVSQSVATLIFGLAPVVGIIASLSGGYLGDRWGAKRILSVAYLGTCLFLILLAFATDIPSLSVFYVIFSFWNTSVWTPMNGV
jgi:predicted MFS family arabinose efflux permease